MLKALDHATIFASLPTPTIILLPDEPAFTILEVNEAYLELAATNRENLVGKGFFDALKSSPYQNFPEGPEFMQTVLATKKPLNSPMRSYKFPADDGQGFKKRYFKVVNVPVLDANDEVELIIRSATDITDTVLTQQKEENAQVTLQETSLLMAQGQELANFGNWRWDVLNNKVTWSENLYTIYGLDKDSFKATFEGYQELLHPEDRERVYYEINNVLKTKKDVVFEERIIRPNGDMRYLRSWGKVQTDADGNPVTMIGACLDITDSKLTETKLQFMHQELENNLKILALSEKKYSTLFHLSPLPMWAVDINTLRFLDVNKAAVELYGYTREEFLSMTNKSLWPTEEIKNFSAKVSSDQYSYALPSRHVKKNGDMINVYVQSTLVDFNGRNVRLILVNDITERQKYIDEIEKQNQQLQEIAWIQSHVVRVPLVRMMGLIELFKIYQSSEIDRQELINNIAASANELDTIIKEISGKTEVILQKK